MKISKKNILISLVALFSITVLGSHDDFGDLDSLYQNDKRKKLEAFFQEFESSNEVFEDLKSSYIKYEKFVLSDRQRALNWQHISSIIIFFVVIIIVLTGLVLSYYHFKNSLQSKENSETELEFSKIGIKLKSSIVGITILVVSIVFFYLYLIHVYKIKEIEPYKIKFEQSSLVNGTHIQLV